MEIGMDPNNIVIKRLWCIVPETEFHDWWHLTLIVCDHDVIDNGMHQYEDIVNTAAENSAEVVQISLDVVPEKLWNVLGHQVGSYQEYNSLLTTKQVHVMWNIHISGF